MAMGTWHGCDRRAIHAVGSSERGGATMVVVGEGNNTAPVALPDDGGR